MAKYYSKKGDNGFTDILGKKRLPKHHIRLETIGAIDEASAAIGIARATVSAEKTKETLLTVQRDLYKMMAEVSASTDVAERFRSLNSTRVTWLEDQIENIGTSVKMPQDFIAPGDSPTDASLAYARTVVRRAERSLAKLHHKNEMSNQNILHYINRLSTLIFVLELSEIQKSNKTPPTILKE